MTGVRVFRADRPGPLQELTEPEPGDINGSLLWVDVGAIRDERCTAEALERLGLGEFDAMLLPFLRAGSVEEAGRAGGLPPPNHAAGKRLRTGVRHRLVAATDVLVTPADSSPPTVATRPVHLLAGPGWVLTARPPADFPTQQGRKQVSVEELRDRVQWTGWRTASSHDFATLMLRGLVARFPPAIDALTAYHHRAEQAYVAAAGALAPQQRMTKARTLEESVVQIRPPILALDRELIRLSRPGLAAPEAWFSARQTSQDAYEIEALIEECLAAVRQLLDVQRGSLQLVASATAAEQLKVADSARRRADGLQTLVMRLTALLLVPTLVASVFGALPGILEDCLLGRFALVVGVTVLSIGLGELYVRKRKPPQQNGVNGRSAG